jgi:hypothetical protein
MGAPTATFQAAPSSAASEPPPQLSAQSPAAAEALEAEFRRVCETELRANVGRLKLYLEEEKTVRVLVEHVVERVMDAYLEFTGAIRRFGVGAGAVRMMGVGELRDFLDGVCQG